MHFVSDFAVLNVPETVLGVLSSVPKHKAGLRLIGNIHVSDELYLDLTSLSKHGLHIK